MPEAGLAPFVPRITLTFPALASARETLVLVTGAGKQEPLRRLARGEDLPARHLRSVGRLVWLVDRDGGRGLICAKRRDSSVPADASLIKDVDLSVSVGEHFRDCRNVPVS